MNQNTGASVASNMAPGSRSSDIAAPNDAKPTHFILLTPYPVEPGHTLISIVRLNASDYKPEMAANAAYVAEGDNAGIIINKKANIMDYNKAQASQKERLQPPNAKMSFKVFLINSETANLTLEHRTLRFWLDNNNNSNNNGSGQPYSDDVKFRSSFVNLRQESSQLAQAYFRQLIGTKPDDFPKLYVNFIMKLMRLLKTSQFSRVAKMEIELRQLAQEAHKYQPPSRVSSIDVGHAGDNNGRGSPLTSQKVLDIIESSYPNPISIKEICSTTQTDEPIVRQFVDELAGKAKINSTDGGQHFTRTIEPVDSKVNLVKQMPKVIKSQQPVIAIITSQFCEKLAVDSMISDKITFERFREPDESSGRALGRESRTSSSANYVYTLGNIGDHRVVSTKLPAIGHSRGAHIAAGSATTRLLGIFPEIEYVFLVGCGGGVVDYTDFSSHVRLGDLVVSHLSSDMESCNSVKSDNSSPVSSVGGLNGADCESGYTADCVYVHCRPKQQRELARSTQSAQAAGGVNSGLPVSYSVHKNLSRLGNNGVEFGPSATIANEQEAVAANTGDGILAGQGDKPLEYEECHFRLWRPAKLELQELAQRLWSRGLENQKHRIWEYYIDEGIKSLAEHHSVSASRPKPETDKLFMSIGMKDTIEVNHPEANEDEIDLRKLGRPMCHFGPIGSGQPVKCSEPLRQRMISEFGLRAFDSEFDPVVESIYGNRMDSYIMIRGISDYKDGTKRKEWQQYSALVAAAFMKSIIINMEANNYP